MHFYRLQFRIVQLLTLVGLVSMVNLVSGQSCPIQSAPFKENFSDTSWQSGVYYNNRYNSIDGCWSRNPDPTINTDGFDAYHWGTRQGATYQGNTGPNSDHTRNDTTDRFIYAPGPTYGYNQDTAFITSPAVDLSTISNPRAGFWYFMYGEDVGTLLFQVSADSGNTWNTLHTITDQQQFSATAPWQQKLINLSGYANDTIQVRFAVTATGHNGDIAIDDLALEATPSCVKPSNLAATNFSDSSAAIQWTSNNPASTYRIQWDTAGFALGKGDSTTSSNTTYTPTQLKPNTIYDVYVAEKCNAQTVSRYRGPYRFRTNCSPKVTPYHEDFDNGATTKPFNNIDCWYTAGNRFETISLTSRIYNITNQPTAPNQVAFEGQDINSGDTALLVSPQFSDLSDYDNRIRVHLGFEKRPTNNSELYVGVMDKRENAQSFTSLDTIEADFGGIYQQHRISLDDTVKIGSKDRVAIVPSGTGQYDEIGLDSFVYEAIPSCDFPADLSLAGVGSDSATIGWKSKASGSQWIIEWGPDGFSRGNGNTITSSSTSATLNSLSSNTDYDVYVAEVCSSSGDTSRYVGPFSFTTNCQGTTATYTENFDQPSPADPFEGVQCWHAVGNRSYTIALQRDRYRQSKAPTQPNEVHFELVERSNQDTAFLVTEPLTDLSGYNNRVRFHASFEDGNRNSSQAQRLLVGVMKNRASPETFQPLDTVVSNKNRTYDQYRVSLGDTSLIGNKQHLAFTAEGSYYYDEIELDSVVYEVEPSCDFPGDLETTSIEAQSVTLDWTSKDTGSQWIVQWGQKGFNLSNGNFDTTNSKPYTLNGLSAATKYDVYIAEVCKAGDKSRYAGPISFETNCLAKTANYNQNFDQVSRRASIDKIDCWDKSGDEADEIDLVQNSYSTEAPVTSPNEIRFETLTLSNDTALWLAPTFSDITDYNNRTRFQAAFEGGNQNNNKLLIGLVDDKNTPSSFTAVDTVTDNTDGNYSQYRIPLNDTSKINSGQRLAFATDGNDDYRDITLDNFNYEAIPACDFPGNLSASNIQGTSAEISWKAYDTNGQWLIQWGKQGFQLGQGNIKATNTNPDTLTGLKGITSYDVYIAQVCNSTDTSRYAGPLTFRTNCPPSFTAEYTEKFDDVAADYDFGKTKCWQATGNEKRRMRLRDRLRWINAYSLPNQVVFDYANLNSGDSAILVSPALSDLNNYDKRLRFRAAFEYVSSRTNNKLYVGVMPSQTNNGALTIVDTLSPASAKTYNEYKVPLTDSSLIDTAKHIALVPGTSRDVAVDNITYEDTPTCELPSKLTVSNIGQTTASFNWKAHNSSNQWKVQWGQRGFKPGHGKSSVVSDTSHQANSLSAGTRYDVYVAEICGTGDTSKYRGPVAFKTPCQTDTIPYKQDFSSGFPVCWSRSDKVSVQVIDGCNGPNSALQISDTTKTSTGKLNVSGAQNLKVNYEVAAGACGVSPRYNDTLLVEYWDGNQWQRAKQYDRTTPESFTKDSFYVKAQSLSSQFQLRFRVKNGSYRHGFQVDAIQVQEGPDCLPPKAITLSNITTSSVDASWTSLQQGSARSLQWGQKGFTLGQGDSASTTSNPYTITSLKSGKRYDVYVAEECSSGSQSPYRGSYTFNTDCQAKALPYRQNFSNGFPLCWFRSNDEDIMHRQYCRDQQKDYLKIENSKQVRTPEIDASNAQSLKVNYELTPDDCRSREGSHVSFAVEYWNGSKWVVGSQYDGNFSDSFQRDSFYVKASALGSDFQLRFNMTAGGRYDEFSIANLDVEEGPTCLPPKALEPVIVNATSADVTWQSLEKAGQRRLQWDTSGFDLGKGDSATTTNDPYTITGLQAQTTYDVYVAEVCGNNNESPYRGPLTIETRCQPTSIPDTTNFSSKQFPSCWYRPAKSDISIDTNCRTGSHVLNIESREPVESLPEVQSPLYDGSSFQTLTVAFDWGDVCHRGTYGNDTIKFQYWDGAGWKTQRTVNGDKDPESFKLDSFVAADPSNLPSNFRFRIKSNNSYTSWQFDSVVVKEGPSCVKVESLDTSNVTSNSATVDWNSRLNGSQWKVQWGTKGFKLGQGQSAIASNASYTLTGLQSNKVYEVYVAEICGPGDTSSYASPISFTTDCGIVQAPYHKPFDKSALRQCFTTYGNAYNNWRSVSIPPQFPFNDHTGTGGNLANGNVSQTSDTNVLETPEVDISNLNNPELSFYLLSVKNGPSNGANELTVDFYDGSQWHNQVLTYAQFSRKWVHQTIDLTNYTISGPVKARFTVDAKAGAPSYHVIPVDDIAFREQSDTVTWYGTNDTLWSNSSNWENGQPDSNKTLLIPKGKVRYPDITNQALGGDLIIRNMGNSSLVMNGKSLELKGDLVNDGKADLGDGVLKLTGNNAQTLKGNSAIKVDSITLKNAQGITAESDLTVEKTLTLKNGIIGMNNGKAVKVLNDATIKGSGDTAYIDGPVTKTGDDAFTFPIGDNGQWARLGISAPTNTADAFTASYQKAGYGNTSSFAMPGNNPNSNPQLNNVSQNEYWTLSRDSGSSSVDVTLYWENGTTSAITDVSKLKVAHWNDSTWQNFGQDANSGNTASGSITVNNVDNFSPFTFGSTSSTDNPLPVELTNFSAEPNNGNVILEWSTASETRNRHFVVQRRSEESEQWKSIGTVLGEGTTSEPQAYQFIDQNPEASIHYYRLKQVDFDGRFEYSNVRAVELGKGYALDVQLKGNPVNDHLNLSLNVPQRDQYKIRILNSTGKETFYSSHTLPEGDYDIRIPVSHMAAGLYILHIEGDLQVANHQFMIK